MILLLLLAQAEGGSDTANVPNAMGAHTWFVIIAVGAFLLWSISYSLQLHKEALARRKGRDELRRQYEAWFLEMSAAHNFAPPRIVLGADFENPATLSRQDFRGPNVGWEPDAFGYWEVDVARAGSYRITLQTFPAESNGSAHFRLNGVALEQV